MIAMHYSMISLLCSRGKEIRDLGELADNISEFGSPIEARFEGPLLVVRWVNGTSFRAEQTEGGFRWRDSGQARDHWDRGSLGELVDDLAKFLDRELKDTKSA
jgi:hypothetical protein